MESLSEYDKSIFAKPKSKKNKVDNLASSSQIQSIRSTSVYSTTATDSATTTASDSIPKNKTMQISSSSYSSSATPSNKSTSISASSNSASSSNQSTTEKENEKETPSESEKALRTSDYFANKDISATFMDEMPVSLPMMSSINMARTSIKPYKSSNKSANKLANNSELQNDFTEYYSESVPSTPTESATEPITDSVLFDNSSNKNLSTINSATDDIRKRMNDLKKMINENITSDEIMTDIVDNAKPKPNINTNTNNKKNKHALQTFSESSYNNLPFNSYTDT